MALKLVLEFAICTVTKSTLPRLNFIAIMFDITCHDHVRNRTSTLHTIHMDVRNQTFQLHTLEKMTIMTIRGLLQLNIIRKV